MYNYNKISRKEYVLVAIFSVFFVFGILTVTGVLFSGYHLIDDHVLIRRIHTYNHSDSSLYEKVLAGFPWAESRFLPICTLLRNLGCVVFQENFFYWQVFRGLEITLSLCFGYYVARQFGVNQWMAALFGGLLIIGQQSTGWCRLGAAEPLGLMFLMIALFFLQKYEISCKKGWLWFGILTAIFSSWSKESFTLVLPFVPMLMMVYDLVYVKRISKFTREGILKCMKKNTYLLLILFGVFVWNLYQILFKFGVDFNGYAGLDDSLGIFGYIKRMGGMILFRFSFYFWGLVIAGGVCIFILILKKRDIRAVVERNSWLLGISIIIILSQVFLHAKSGMYDRYFIPTVVAVAMIAIVVVYDILKDYSKVLMSYEIILSCLLFSIIVFTLIPYADRYTQSGEDNRKCFEKIAEIADKDSIIIADIDPECNLAVESYLEFQLGYTTVLSTIEGAVVDLKNIHGETQGIPELLDADYIITTKKEGYESYEDVLEQSSISLWKKK